MQDFLIHTKDAFDKIAHSYDEEDSSNEILQWMRKVVYKIYLSNFEKGNKLLELNAGTGIDAVFLASKGMKVYATDISEKMISNLQEKINWGNLSDFIRAENLSFDELHNMQEKDFDGAISNFGGLNCINDFSQLSEILSDKIKPGGRFIAAVMNRFCPWEIFYFLLKLDGRNAFRRFNENGIDANLSRFKIKSFYFTPGEFAEQFERHFEIEKIFSLGLFTPPPYLYGMYEKSKPLVNFLMKIDSGINNFFPFNKAGDHFVIVLKRKAKPA